MSLTQREFLFLDDLLHQEELEIKCHLDWAERAHDQNIKQLFLSLARQHQQHYDRLLGFLGQVTQTQYSYGTQPHQGSTFQSQPAFSGVGSQGYFASSTAGYGSNPVGSGNSSSQHQQPSAYI